MTDHVALWEFGSTLSIDIDRTYTRVELTYLLAFESRDDAINAMRSKLAEDGIDKPSIKRVTYDPKDVGKLLAMLHESVEEYSASIKLAEVDPVISVHTRMESRAAGYDLRFGFCADAKLSVWVKPCEWLPITQNWPTVNGRVSTRRVNMKGGGLASWVGIDSWIHVDGDHRKVVEVEKIGCGEYRAKR